MDEFGRIDTEPPPAVKSLRSRFEQLALDASQKSNPNTATSSRQNGSNDLLAPGGQSSPRQRTTSGTFTHSSADPELLQHHLRTTSSSSDLQLGINRPPPPPPSRGPKATPPSPVPSPSPSPLLRPVPIPPGVSTGNGLITSTRVGFSSLPSVSNRSVLLVDLSQDSEVLESPVHSAASCRGKFSTMQPKSFHSPRASISSVYPSAGCRPPSSTLISSPKPVIPPRPPRPASGAEMTSTPIFLPIQQKRNSDESSHSLSVSPDQHASLHSPFSDESTDEVFPAPTVPPPPSRPARKSQPLLDLHEDTVRFPLPPPRPPPRIRGTASSGIFVDSPGSSSSSLSSLSTSTSTTSAPPPPLPARRGTSAYAEEPPPTKPRLPTRPSPPFQLSIPSHAEASSSPSSTPIERKALGSGRLPPPPTRTIALGEKLPPARRPPSPSSDEDSDDEADSKAPTVDSLPDSSRSSRRPPLLSFREGSAIQPRIAVHAFTGHFCLSGTTAVAAQHHHVRMYDLVVGDVAMHTVDLREAGGGLSKDIKVTSIEFRPCREKEDRGHVVWLGTKEGALLEMDTRSGAVTATRWAAHPHPVTHVFRCGRAMVTLDDGGKALIWAPESADGDDVDLVKSHPRVMRIAEKQDFVKMVGGKLWTAARVDQVANGTAGGVGATKVPVLRVYDLFKLGNVVKTVTPTEHVGAVTSATIMPSQPDHVYIGHEEGFVSVWLLAADDGIPKCEEVMKVSTSDVLCLEGVNDRLWAGGRSGLISAYDTTQKPWVVTNCWNAHPGLPVVKLGVDAMGIEKTGRLCVVSVGRDEVVRFWDGLLGLDWIEEELLKRENSFSNFRNLSVLLVSWNCDSARPDSLTGDPANVNFLTDVLHSVDSPDIVSFGFQEVIDLESRRMAAKNVLLGSKKGPEGVLSDKVTGAYKRWYDRLTSVMRQAVPPGVAYAVVHTESLVGLFTCVFVKQSEKASLKDIAITTIKRGMGGRYGNKGGIVARFVVDDSSICLINCHLAAGQNHVRQRNADVTGMLEEKSVFPETDLPLAYIGGGDGSMVLDHEIVFVNGDMNYRIDHRRDAIVSAVRADDLNTLLSHDQLLREIKHNRACRFRDFSEGPITFMPTYKYDPRTDEYDSSEKRRSPAWCDRVLWRTRDPSRVQQLHYQRYEANVSDHRPISAAFMITVKSVRHEVREKVKKELQEMWMDQQIRLLLSAREFYIREALV